MVIANVTVFEGHLWHLRLLFFNKVLDLRVVFSYTLDELLEVLVLIFLIWLKLGFVFFVMSQMTMAFSQFLPLLLEGYFMVVMPMITM